MWTIGQKVEGGWTVETGPLRSRDTAVRQSPDGKMKKIGLLMLLALAGFIVVLLAGCSDAGGSGGVRATAEALGTRFPSGQTEATPSPAVQVVEATRIVVQPVEVTRIVEATVIVEQPVVQPVEVTRIVEVVVTATPDIQGFPAPDAAGQLNAPAIVDSGVNESIQPCPAKLWKRGRCVANATQIQAAAEGGE